MLKVQIFDTIILHDNRKNIIISFIISINSKIYFDKIMSNIAKSYQTLSKRIHDSRPYLIGRFKAGDFIFTENKIKQNDVILSNIWLVHKSLFFPENCYKIIQLE